MRRHHQYDLAGLGRWLSSKTPEIFKRGSDPAMRFSSRSRTAILAVGSVTDAGEITLNVSPNARFRGISTALLGTLERRAREHGNKRCTLYGTETARRFYLARGYSEEGPSAAKFGTNSAYPTSKVMLDLVF